MAPRRARISARQVIVILQRNGYRLVGQHGSHRKWRNEITDKQINVPFHKDQELALGTLISIVQGTGLDGQPLTR